jgi:hypothetical protein
MSTAGYRRWYARLLRLYPRAYRDRFAEGMEQTFNDLLRERRDTGRKLFGFVLWMYVETATGIARESVMVSRPMMKKLVMPMLTVLAATAVLLAVYFANGADDPWYYVTAWLIVLSSLVPFSTTKDRENQ